MTRGATMKVVRAYRVSGYVLGPCTKCGKEERGLLMFDDYDLGVECLACKEIERVDRVEWVEDDRGDPVAGLLDEED